ncbi:MAG: amino acid adenylation domain-containing protein, partial [Chloroflexi bacterium]|nr:amino acid adenylation domain-containing protein [Chloroflexota bacterium]
MNTQDYSIEDASTTLDLTDDVFVFPASFAQERLWIIEQMVPNTATYNLPVAIRMQGALDVAVLQASLSAIVARHETLRTIFATEDNQLVQVVVPELPLHLEQIDLSAAERAQREDQARQLVAQEAQRPFDLQRGPLLRATLLGLADDEQILVLNLHHSIADGWSIGVLLRELSAIYRDLLRGASVALPELELQYADFTIWERERLESTGFAEQLAYWQQQLADASTTLSLPTDRPHPPVQSFRGATHSFTLPAWLVQQLKTLSQREEVTLFTTLLSGFQTLLYRLSGQSDVLVGSPIANRASSQTETLIGFFVNTLVLRASFTDAPSFRSLLKQVRQTTLDAYSNQDVPFERIVDALHVERSLSRNPLFQTVFVLRDDLLRDLDLPNLRLSPVELDTGTAKFELTLDLWESADGLQGRAEYSTDLFDAGTIVRLVAQFQQVLESVVAAPDLPLDRLPLLIDHDRQKIAQWSAAPTEYPRDLGIHQLFEAQAARAPESIAVTLGNVELRYAELNRRANQLAHTLRARGVGPDVCVGICLEREPELLVAILGVLKAGGAYLPLDPSYPGERLITMLRDACAPLVLTHSRLLGALPDDVAEFLCLDAEAQTIARQPSENLVSDTTAQSLAYVMYTSGSTGQPKGIAVPHQAVVRLVQQTNYAQFGPDERVLQLAPLAFDASTFELWGALLNGATLVLYPEARPSLDRLAQAIRTERITTLWLTAGLFHQMVDTHLDALASLRQLLAGGDVLSVAHVRRAAQALRQGRVINGYGPTENTTFSCCYRVDDPERLGSSVPIGGPIANTQVYVLDTTMQPVGIGVPGELYIGGDGLARGYLNQPALTAERFVPSPFRAGARLYRSGDWVRWRADGTLEFLGRIDGQIKLRGFRVELGEVEAVLRQHPEVQDAAAAVRYGVGHVPQLVAYVTEEPRTKNQEPNEEQRTENKEQSSVTALLASPEIPPRLPQWERGLGGEGLRSFLQSRLPEFLVPNAIVVLDALPLTPNGKLDRRALPELPELTGRAHAEYVAPRTQTEQQIAAIWADVLKIERMGVEDNFFDLGGHSLLATQLLVRLRAELGIDLSLQTIFEYPSIAELARQIAPLEPADVVPQSVIPRVSRAERLPLSFPQQRLWLLDQLEPESVRYNLAFAIRLQGALDAEVLRRALEALVQRHEALRTTFADDRGEPIQIIHAPAPWPLPVIDTSLDALAEMCAAEAQRPFDLKHGPLFRSTLLKIATTEHVLLLAMHHIISDGWSMGVLFRELSALYASADLAPLPIQYADFAVWQRAQIGQTMLDAQVAYWKQRLQHVATLELPTDRPRPLAQSYHGRIVYIDLPDDLSAALIKFAETNGATLFMTLLAGFQVLLQRYSGQDDIVVGTPIANRQHRQIEDLIGFFANTLVLRGDLAGNPSFLELLGRVRTALIGDYDHQDVPFELLVEALDVPRDISRSPLFQVMFALQSVDTAALDLPEIVSSRLDIAAHTTKFDLAVFMEQTERGLRAMVEYSTDLFDATTIARLLEHYAVLLRGAIAAPEQPIAALPILTEVEKQQLAAWNATSRAYPPATLTSLVAQQAVRTPDAIAVVSENAQLTYRALDERANQLAHALRPLLRGTSPLVAVCLDRSPELVVTLLGLLKAGAAFVPLDPAYPGERLEFMLADAQAAALITDSRLVARLPQASSLPVLLIDGAFGETIGQMPTSPPSTAPTPDDLAYVIYTSGSTGQPKGAINTHRGIVNRLRWGQERYGLRADDRLLQKTPLSFDVSVWEL